MNILFNLLKKVIYIPLKDNPNPNFIEIQDLINQYCKEYNYTLRFIDNKEIEIDGKKYVYSKDFESGSRGNYAIKCIEK